MATKKGGLGRGLGALLTQTAAQYNKTTDTVIDIDVEKIIPNRYQPRHEFDIEALNELAESIKTYGILQPLIVRKIENGYELIAGERRLRASKIVGLVKVPAIIRDYTDAQMSEISIIENVQRENLNVIEEAQAYDRLIKEFGHTQEVVAVKIGRSRSHISNMLRLLKLTPPVRDLVSKGKLTLGQARPLLAIENPIIQQQAAEMVLTEGLSVRKVEAFINELKNSGLLASLTANIENPQNVENISYPSEPVQVTSNVESIPNIETTENVETAPNIESIPNIETTENVKTAPNIESVSNVETTEKIESHKINQLETADTGIEFEPAATELTKTVDNSNTSDKISRIKYTTNKKGITNDVYVREAESRLTNILGAKVKITSNKKCNRIQIDFSGEEELSRIIESFDQSILIMSNNKQSPALISKEDKIAALRRYSTQNFNI